jgi:hypothetical protein
VRRSKQGGVGVDVEKRGFRAGQAVVQAVKDGGAVDYAGDGFAAVSGFVGCLEGGVDADFWDC